VTFYDVSSHARARVWGKTESDGTSVTAVTGEDHIPARDGYPGMIRFHIGNGRTVQALGDPDKHARFVRDHAAGNGRAQ
jgi:hypothetical protein